MYQYGWFSPNGENVNFGILSKLTFHSLMKETPLGNKVNKCPERQQFLPKARLVYNQAGVQGSSSRASISRAEPFQNIQPQSLEGQNILQGA